MSVGSWSPQSSQTTLIDGDLLDRVILLSQSDRLSDLDNALSKEDRHSLPRLMKADHALWQETVAARANTEIFDLIRFFTAAENLAGCEAGAQSPVIPLARLLRRRGQKLDRETLLWMRQVNRNRFLPYGPL